MTQKTLFDKEEEVEKETEEQEQVEEEQVEEEQVEEEQEEDIKIGIRIAESEIDHDFRTAFNNIKNKKKKAQAKKLLQEITVLSLSGAQKDEQELDIFAKVIHLEKVLGMAYNKKEQKKK